MDKVLIVDGDADFVKNLKAGLEKLQQFEVLIAVDGQEALACLKNGRISVLVCDIQTPKIECLELLSFMTEKHPGSPCIVTTDMGKPWFREELSQQTFLYHLEKPFSIGAIASAIFVGLNLRDEGLNRRGMTMASLLPLVELQQKTCRMRVASADAGKGYLYFDRGVLFDAFYSGMDGEEAAKEISSWNRIGFKLSELPRQRTRKRVKTNIMEIVDASWQKEEALAPGDVEPADLRENEPSIPLTEEVTPFEIDWEKSGRVLQDFLNRVKKMKGYLAFALVDEEGKILAADQSEYVLNLRIMARHMKPLFADARHTADQIKIGRASALTLHCPSSTILMQAYQMNLFIIIVCNPQGDWSEMKIRLDEMVQSLED